LRTLAALDRLERGQKTIGPSKHLKVLRGRLAYLDAQIRARTASPATLDFYRGERDALTWAIKQLAKPTPVAPPALQ
jgi:hypothetical protein